MRIADYLAALQALPVATLDDLVGSSPFAILSPHPDDESLGCGGLIAAARDRGQPVHVLILTDGSASHPNSLEFPTERLVALRRDEVARAGEALGLPGESVTHLGMIDADTPKSGGAFDDAVGEIVSMIDRSGIRTLLATWAHDPHCDHEAAAAMAEAAVLLRPEVRLLFYPIWGWHLDPETMVACGPPAGSRLDIAPWQTRKQAAIEAHASQMTDLIADDPDGFRFTPEKLAPFLGSFETFIGADRP